MRLRPVLMAMGLAAFGYGAAVGVAVPVTLFLMWLTEKSTMDGASGAQFLVDEFPAYLLGGMMMTIPAALPGYLLVLHLSWRNHWRHWLAYAAAGAFNAVVALAILHAYGTMGWWPRYAAEFVLACMGGGFAGGAAYWLAAGRWREKLYGRVDS